MFGLTPKPHTKFIKTMIDAIIEREGGFVDHPLDKGGPTKYGITQSTYGEYMDCEVTTEEVKNITPQEAHEIYRVNYYIQPALYLLPKQLQPFIFDACINHGPINAVVMLQSAINRIHNIPDNEPRRRIVKEDGIVGRQTAKWANWFEDNAAITLLVNRREEFYHAIVESRPDQNVFLNGWLNRLKDFRGRV